MSKSETPLDVARRLLHERTAIEEAEQAKAEQQKQAQPARRSARERERQKQSAAEQVQRLGLLLTELAGKKDALTTSSDHPPIQEHDDSEDDDEEEGHGYTGVYGYVCENCSHAVRDKPSKQVVYMCDNCKDVYSNEDEASECCN